MTTPDADVTPDSFDWEAEAKRILRTELERFESHRYKVLVAKLAAIGIKDNEMAIASRISRGKFSFIFFLQCMKALGVREVEFRIRKDSPKS